MTLGQMSYDNFILLVLPTFACRQCLQAIRRLLRLAESDDNSVWCRDRGIVDDCLQRNERHSRAQSTVKLSIISIE